MYSNEFISLLIDCEKIIIDAPGKLKPDRGNLKSNFTMKSKDGKFSFYGFIRRNIKFQENFSVGLIYNPREERGTVELIRCNGPHGENNVYPHHINSHIHRASAERINTGLKPDGEIEMTNEYTTLDEGIQYYLKLINLTQIDRIKYFSPPSGQLDLFKDE